MKRKNLKINGFKFVMALLFVGMLSCKDAPKKQANNEDSVAATVASEEPFFKLSLAQWSMHRMIRNEGVDPYSFAQKASEWGFSGLEYVSGLYYDELGASNFSKEAMDAFVAKNNAESEKYGLKNLLIMIDGQGDLATPDAAKRKAAVENHYKWVDAAAAMGCHAIRVNLSGSNNPEEWVASSVDGLTQLSTYAKDKGINVLVENHGGLSSNGALLAEVMTKVDMENCGTLPDFGNFCIKRTPNGCDESYDPYQGLSELMPHALAVSAKSNVFDAEGNERNLDYARILKIVKDAGYTGYIGVEYEGGELSEEEGIIATRDLLIKEGSKLN
ncbi:sugar phosphate isomerase/epimerase family protein [Arenibacter latericius]|uniref:sugar phosphate isomerase/epimerase family protein n=1 Tax=Arenibacter latericius TaxID=86104 RepID=UPI000479C8CD|nr:sugar phosphate isomerase/epimerase family protein [Arenibacter latericius]MDX1363855.1 sugar phosphate isomerase/epimerase family protein [Arenibacter latericius]